MEADLALGHHAESVAELDSLARQHPTHERFVMLLMIALYRSDRQVDALGAYSAAYKQLVAVGLEPGPELKLTQERVLNRDTALDLPSRMGGLRAGHMRKQLEGATAVSVGRVS